MIISGTDLGKKFGKNWVFRNISFEISARDSVAITGSNGSGKSTLLQIISQALTPSKGKIEFTSAKGGILAEDIIQQINFCSPYGELIEELSLAEHLVFHSKFKIPNLSVEEIINKIGLGKSRDKPISDFSSGMKQRVKLALQFYYEGAILALDEPTSNLDNKGIQWYQDEIQQLKGKRIILVASNLHSEYDFCNKTLDLSH